ncbi:hypothetical protein D3C77_443540 [compost metagenome]
MDIIERYSRVHANLAELAGSSTSCIFMALEQFDAEGRKVIASRLYEVFRFNFDDFEVQNLVRDNLKSLSPDANLSWIPDWRMDNEALLAST